MEGNAFVESILSFKFGKLLSCQQVMVKQGLTKDKKDKRQGRKFGCKCCVSVCWLGLAPLAGLLKKTWPMEDPPPW